MNYFIKLFIYFFIIITSNITTINSLNVKLNHSKLINLNNEAIISIGPCVNNLCPKGFECIENTCFKATEKPKSDRILSIGPCVNEKCPEGFDCLENECYANN
ncbi:hypothetical protein Mgra_00000232 [Meloidogyne graminicola]|uniref:CC domain-containing protein n=1 Tax=Meloidogyne graminicola TaxID=189291 RepID=A0A8T0A4E6_9BILA|nr:hypothetical protein Mgra_00000232 [Meloidogyne graminicola]